MAEHTPGPWTIDLDDERRYGSYTIQQFDPAAAYLRSSVDGIEDAANARLIAAAPALLEALLPFVRLGDDGWQGTVWEGATPDALVMYRASDGASVTVGDFDRARAAIAQARGEAHG